MPSSSIPFPRSTGAAGPISSVSKNPSSPSSDDGTSSSSSGYLSSDSSDSDSNTDDYDSDEERVLIQQEWEESLRQIQALVSIVIMPFFGRWYGRKWSFWAYDRYRAVGLTRKFLGI